MNRRHTQIPEVAQPQQQLDQWRTMNPPRTKQPVVFRSISKLDLRGIFQPMSGLLLETKSIEIAHLPHTPMGT